MSTELIHSSQKLSKIETFFSLSTCALYMPRNGATIFLFPTRNIFTRAKLYSQYWLSYAFLVAVRTQYWFPICNIYNSMWKIAETTSPILNLYIILFRYSKNFFQKVDGTPRFLFYTFGAAKTNERIWSSMYQNTYFSFFTIPICISIRFKTVCNICYGAPIFWKTTRLVLWKEK